MARLRITPWLIAAGLCGAFAASALPRGIESGRLLAIEDDPVAIAERAVDRTFDATVAEREIKAALADNDAELAKSFLDLAESRDVDLDPALAGRVAAATSPSASAIRTAGQFTRGLVTGEPDDAASLAGTALGDLFVFGDIRDVIREGAHIARGEDADDLVLGLACVGIAITAGTYFTVGAAVPARIGVSLVKAARKTGRIGSHMAAWLGRSLREVVDMAALRRAAAGVADANPAVAVRAVREVVKVEKSDALLRLAHDVGRIRAKAGTTAALDAFKVARGPKDVARVAKLAEKEGGKTRAILKLAGRGAIFLSLASWNLASWLLWIIVLLFGFVSGLKGATERGTLRYVRWRKARRARRMALETEQALARAWAAG